MSRGRWRLRLARWLAPSGALTEPPAVSPPPPQEMAQAPEASWPNTWAELSEQIAWRLLVLTEQARPALDELEDGEDDPERLARLYQVDHAVTRIRRVARDLRVLADRGSEEVAGHTTSLLDVIRVAASAIEHYGRVTIGPVAELAVVPYAADDVASLLAALADNATRYSPSPVTVSAHLLADGSVMLRVEDAGLGIDSGGLDALNTALSGPVPSVGVLNGRHTGFAVIHRLARRHGLRVQLARRQPPGRAGAGSVSGTIAMAVIPAPLLCEIPGEFAPAGRGIGQRQLPQRLPAAEPAGQLTAARAPSPPPARPPAARPQEPSPPGASPPAASPLPARVPAAARSQPGPGEGEGE
ncbi:MAG: ATP-binding protein, partial [Actinobacteria bacterium]|nr:ATP-binding protein [Actinomycetota bacterium]